MDEPKKIYYIEFSLTGVFRVDEEQKTEALAKLTKLISKVIQYDDIELIKFDKQVEVISEEEILNSMIHYPDDNDIN